MTRAPANRFDPRSFHSAYECEQFQALLRVTGTTPLGLKFAHDPEPRVAASRQPWAEGRKPRWGWEYDAILIFFYPKGVMSIAQGCREAATLGRRCGKIQPQRGCARDMQRS